MAALLLASIECQRVLFMSIVSDAWLAAPQTRRPVQLAVLVPVYNERPMLPILHDRLRSVLDGLDISYEILLVDDGSSDGSGQYLAELAAANPNNRAIRLSRNFGKEAALTAGLSQTAREAVKIMAADERKSAVEGK